MAGKKHPAPTDDDATFSRIVRLINANLSWDFDTVRDAVRA